MGLYSNFPYTDFENLNLDWIIKNVKEYIQKYVELEKFVNASLEEQKNYIDKALNDFRTELNLMKEELEEFMNYVRDNIQEITNTIINEMIEAGTLYVGIEYTAETEALNIVVSENQGG